MRNNGAGIRNASDELRASSPEVPLWRDVATILGQFALTAASIVTVLK